jgi:hypothetical protein
VECPPSHPAGVFVKRRLVLPTPSKPAQEPVLEDEVDTQRAVAVLVEEHHHRVSVVPLDGAVTELSMTDS